MKKSQQDVAYSGLFS